MRTLDEDLAERPPIKNVEPDHEKFLESLKPKDPNAESEDEDSSLATEDDEDDDQSVSMSQMSSRVSVT